MAAAYSMGNLSLDIDVGGNFTKFSVLGAFKVDQGPHGCCACGPWRQVAWIQVGGVYKCNSATTMKGKVMSSGLGLHC